MPLIAAFEAVRTSLLPVGEGAGGAIPAEFPGNIMEAHGEGRIPVGRGSTDSNEGSQSGRQ